MELLEFYPHLKGSYCQLRLQLPQLLLDDLCDLLQASMQDSLQRLRVTPTGPNLFRIRAGLSGGLFQWIGELFLNVLRDEGIEIQIQQPCASLQNPTMRGSLTTGVLGKTLAVPTIVKGINQGLNAGDIVDLQSRRRGLTEYEMLLGLNPFPLLRQLLPAGIGHHITDVQLQTYKDSFLLDLVWHHVGMNYELAPRSPGGSKPMNPEVQSFLDRLRNSHFADLKGSWANLHLEFPEHVINEALSTIVLPWIKRAYPAASVVEAAQAKGSVCVDLKLRL